MSRVALLHYAAPPVIGGVESVVGQHARLMADAGHQVCIVAGRGERTDPRSIIDPRFQAGIRITPIETVDLDLIYGRNITGENANWVTVGLNVRFPPPKK